MTPQEKELLERFLADMNAARAEEKDTEAEALIREAVSRQPDAAYLLVQRAIQLDQALALTQSEVQKLKTELERARGSGKIAAPGGGFLNDPYEWGSQRKAAAPPHNAAGQAAPVGAQPQRQPAGRGWGGAGMLGTVASTAAGVVAGSFLFQGIQNLLNRNDESAAAEPPGAQAGAQPAEIDPVALEDTAVDDSSDTFASGDDGGGDFA